MRDWERQERNTAGLTLELDNWQSLRNLIGPDEDEEDGSESGRSKSHAWPSRRDLKAIFPKLNTVLNRRQGHFRLRHDDNQKRLETSLSFCPLLLLQWTARMMEALIWSSLMKMTSGMVALGTMLMNKRSPLR